VVTQSSRANHSRVVKSPVSVAAFASAQIEREKCARAARETEGCGGSARPAGLACNPSVERTTFQLPA
jgi:hypothetical protein